MRITVGPTGRLVRGDIMDVNPKAFGEALRDLDPKLYVTWNPKKLRGWGCWEIRRRPTQKTMLYQGEYRGATIYKLCEVEFHHVHHVLDCAFLNYDAIRKLKEMDVFAQMKRHGVTSYADLLERREEEYRQQALERAQKEREYNVKQIRSEAVAFYEAVRSGINPAQILTQVKWGS